MLALALSADGNLLVAWHRSGRVPLWDRAAGAVVCALPGEFGTAVNDVALSPDGRTVASASDRGAVRLHDLSGGAPVELPGHDGDVEAVAFAPDGGLVAAATDGDRVHLWRTSDGSPVHVLTGPVNHLQAVTVTPDRDRVVATGNQGGLWVWDIATGRVVDRMQNRGAGFDVVVTPDGRQAVSGSGGEIWI